MSSTDYLGYSRRDLSSCSHDHFQYIVVPLTGRIKQDSDSTCSSHSKFNALGTTQRYLTMFTIFTTAKRT